MSNILTEKRILIFILFIAFFVRFASLIVFMHKNNITVHESGMIESDSHIYYQSAINLASGKGYSISVTDQKQKLPAFYKPSITPNTYFHNYYPPVYSFFLSMLYRFLGTSILVYAIPQIIMGTVSCYLTYVIAKEVFSSKAGLMAGFLLSIYHPIVWWTSYIRAETLFIFLLLFAIFFLIKSVKNNLDIKNTILSGFFLAISCLCRSAILYFPIFIVFYYIIIFYKKDKQRLLYGMAIFLLSFYMSLLPWAYRNHTLYNKFVITTTEAWDAFYACNVTSADLPFFDLYEIKYVQEKEDDIAMLAASKGVKEASIAFVKDRPLTYTKLCLKRCIAFWSPITKKPSLIKKVADTFIYIIVFPMAFYGFYKSKWWANAGVGFKPTPTLLITVILYYTILHSVVGVDDALIYRYPIIPLICIFSGYGYCTYFKTSEPEIRYDKSKQ